MDFNKAYKAIHMYYSEGITNVDKISDETGIRPKLINRLIKGDAFPAVLADYKADAEAGDFSRVYEMPKLVRLNQIDYISVYNSFLTKLLSGRETLADVRGFLIEDDIDAKQAKKMYEALETAYNEQIELVLEDKLLNILEVLEQPTKWGIDKAGNVIELYPHPVLNGVNEVIGVQYKKDKSFLIPDELYDVYCSMMADIDAVIFKKEKKQKAMKKVKAQRSHQVRNNKAKQAQAESLMFLWLGKAQAGVSPEEIAKRSAFSAPTIRKYIKKAQEVIK
ncbi:hypothetical protein [Bacillus sp. AFS037270]|uniref:hypothetical protein n=1 Tax=Bacillus sp. AFS037270 TaxID=2033499 RepID=UPI000BFEA8F4|nr:hypothetical protein [Bacillus sp. AFS037270]PGV52470.1 hypothetical protein COD92_09730 [Bacillus sp. AFS037270]